MGSSYVLEFQVRPYTMASAIFELRRLRVEYLSQLENSRRREEVELIEIRTALFFVCDFYTKVIIYQAGLLNYAGKTFLY